MPLDPAPLCGNISAQVNALKHRDSMEHKFSYGFSHKIRLVITMAQGSTHWTFIITRKERKKKILHVRSRLC